MYKAIDTPNDSKLQQSTPRVEPTRAASTIHVPDQTLRRFRGAPQRVNVADNQFRGVFAVASAAQGLKRGDGDIGHGAIEGHQPGQHRAGAAADAIGGFDQGQQGRGGGGVGGGCRMVQLFGKRRCRVAVLVARGVMGLQRRQQFGGQFVVVGFQHAQRALLPFVGGNGHHRDARGGQFVFQKTQPWRDGTDDDPAAHRDQLINGDHLDVVQRGGKPTVALPQFFAVVLFQGGFFFVPNVGKQLAGGTAGGCRLCGKVEILEKKDTDGFE